MATSAKGQCPVCPAINHWPIVLVRNWRFQCWDCCTELRAVMTETVDEDGVVTETHSLTLDL